MAQVLAKKDRNLKDAECKQRVKQWSIVCTSLTRGYCF